MNVIEKAVAWAIETANDQRHGYSQADRWGPDYDCSSFVIEAYEQAGVPVREAGASYTGNMRAAMIACGFVDVTTQIGLSSGYGIEAGDVLLNYSAHTCLAIGGGKVANCRTDEGNPQTGDQSGNEIRIQSYWNYPWNCVLRYKGPSGGSTSGGSGSGGSGSAPTEPRTTLKQGMRGEDVKDLQQRLIDAGYDVGNAGADGKFGNDTFRAVAAFQEDHGIPVTGIADVETIRAVKDAPPKEKELRLPDLAAGSKGDGVVLLQAALNMLGFNCGKADGAFGPMTAAALNRFKEERLLDSDGKADAALWEELLNALLKGVRN